jgi:hypothetical protein
MTLGPLPDPPLEVNRLYGWTRDVWDDRYHAILVSGEETALS